MRKGTISRILMFRVIGESTWLTNVLPKSRFVYYYYYYYYYGFTEAQTIGNEWSERKGEVR